MNQRGASRLLTLAHFLRTQVPKEQFDMFHFNTGQIDEDHPCGSTACALGWCPAVFPKTFRLKDDEFVGAPCLTTTMEDEQEFFSLEPEEYFDLFYTNKSYTPKQQARRIETLVRSYGYDYAEEN